MSLFQEPIGCEPLRIWNRLEGRARKVDFDRVLQAPMHDPLWMLARQWQFGEFKGEDGGSPILMKMARKTTPLSGLQAGSTAFASYSDDIPLEARVERLVIDFDPVMRAHLGRRFLGLLDAAAENLAATAPLYDAVFYRDVFRQAFPLGVTPLDPDDPADALAVGRRRTRAAAYRMQLALAGRAVDGAALAAALRPDMTWADVPADVAADVVPEHAALVLGALQAYHDWFTKLYVVAPNGSSTAWNASQLEYQFACSLRRQNGTDMILAADEYASGRLDWYSFDQGPLISAISTTTPGAEGATDVLTVIPTLAEFAGMPNARWWQFEDGAVDLGHIRADSTDVAKIAVAEFALLYGNNWFVIPCQQPVGTLAEIEGIVVSDVFGWRTSIGAATGSSGGVWTRWDFFSIAPRGAGPELDPLGQHLLLPPVLGQALEGESLEKVAFVRDEMTNTVWAVETRIPDGIGGSRDGSVAARMFRSALDQLEGNASPPPPPPLEAMLRYRLGTTVPENWIPFVPVHKPQETRAIRLQRASMPRFFQGAIAPVRPLTTILREGLDPDDTQQQPYFVNEEEILSAGVVVASAMQRSRWMGGTTVVWNGRRKESGRGGGGSGLRFDLIDVVPKPE